MADCYLAIDLGGTQVRTAIADEYGRVTARREERTDLGTGPDSVVAQIVRMAHDTARDAGLSLDRLRAGAIASPGPLDSKTGVVYSPPNMTGWGEVHLKARLEHELDFPISVVNDANAAALGEYAHGAGRGEDILVYITVSTGIGGGVVIGGTLFEGVSGSAGEIGHMTVDIHGPVCKCGNIGCLEMLASGTAIARRFREAVEAGRISSLMSHHVDRWPTAGDIARAAEEGDELAAAVFTEAAETLGFGVINCLHLYNPNVVVIGGGVTRAGRLLFEPVERIVKRYALPTPRDAARIVPAALGDDAGLVGAAAVARRSMLA